MNWQSVDDTLKKYLAAAGEALPTIVQVVSDLAPSAVPAVGTISTALSVINAALPVLVKLKNGEVPTSDEWAALDAATKADSQAIEGQQ